MKSPLVLCGEKILKKELKTEIFNKILFFRFVTSFQFDDNCSASK